MKIKRAFLVAAAFPGTACLVSNKDPEKNTSGGTVVAAPKAKTFHAPGTTGAGAWEEPTPKNSRDSPLGGADAMGIFITINPHGSAPDQPPDRRASSWASVTH